MSFKEGLRLRGSRGRSSSVLPKHYTSSKELNKYSLPTPSSIYITILCFLVFLYAIIVEMEKRLPEPLLVEDEHNYPGRFIAQRAKNHILNLTSLGPRPTGSFENEVLAVNFFTREINSIFNKANKIHRISTDIQKVSGSFPLDFLDGMTNVYRNVQNVLVKIGPHKESPHSLLVNCHFDTVADSPGGSDDGASCAVMLELLRVISRSDSPLNHNVIFLFNGAEENLMQASHGFVTRHRWAREVRAFVNLEACGAGGRELLFQAGPEHPWLMEAYASSVPYPLASSLAQEIFQSGIIPGETDFRIFRDFGHISGVASVEKWYGSDTSLSLIFSLTRHMTKLTDIREVISSSRVRFNGVINRGGEKEWGWRGPSCQLQIARVRSSVCQEFSGFIGTARLCPHSFSPPRLITPLNLTREELVDFVSYLDLDLLKEDWPCAAAPARRRSLDRQTFEHRTDPIPRHLYGKITHFCL
ncbi:Endoplasmic reticulum metallopeptidase 1, partial [Homalodisca vitripennis]